MFNMYEFVIVKQIWQKLKLNNFIKARFKACEKFDVFVSQIYLYLNLY